MSTYYFIENHSYINIVNDDFFLNTLFNENPNLNIYKSSYQKVRDLKFKNHFNLNFSNKENTNYYISSYNSNLLFAKTYKELQFKTKETNNKFYTKNESFCFMHYFLEDTLYLICFYIYDNIPYFFNYREINCKTKHNLLHNSIVNFIKSIKYKISLIGLKNLEQNICYYTSIYSKHININKEKKQKLNIVNNVSYISHMSFEIQQKYIDNFFNIEYFLHEIENSMEYKKIKVNYFNNVSNFIKFEITPNLKNYMQGEPIYLPNIKKFLKKEIVQTNNVAFFTDASLNKKHFGGGIVMLSVNQPPIYASLSYKEKHLKNIETVDELECLTILYALKYAIDNKIKNVKIYTDSQNFLSAFYQSDKDMYNKLSKIINKIYYCAFQLNLEFIKVKAHSNQAYFNEIADTLAKKKYS